MTRAAAILLILAGISLKSIDLRGRYQRHGAWLEAARWARSNTAGDAVFAMKDAGLFSYFADRRVINLDGKANGYEYLDFLARGDVEAYLRKHGTRYVADVNSSCTADRCGFGIPRAGRPPVIFTLDKATEIYRGEATPGRPFLPETSEIPQFAIWDFAAAEVPPGP